MLHAMIVAAVVAVAPVSVACARSAAAATPEPPGGAWGAWVRERAVPIASDVAGAGFDDLAGVGAMIGDARVVGLGEPTHGTREAFQFKHRLLEYLVERHGFTLFSIEANLPESYALNQYVIDGQGDPKALVGGMRFWTWNTDEVLAMVEWMRGWNQRRPAGSKPLRFTGFDMQSHGMSWEIAREFAQEHAPDLFEQGEPLKAEVDALAARASLGAVNSGWTSATGTFPAEAARGKKLKFAAWIKTRGVTGWAGAWWRCDTPRGPEGFENMQQRAIKGDTDWTRHEFTIDVPPDTQNINFGFILDGDGSAWFDDVEVELDGVRYEDPERFSFDFENDAVRFLAGGSGEFVITRTDKEQKSGKKSLKMRRRPESEVPRVDAAAVVARAGAWTSAFEERRAALAEKAGGEAVGWAIMNARVVEQAARMYSSPDGSNMRDRFMAENVGWILGQHPGERVVLWAHNLHMATDRFGQMVPMGVHLRELFGASYVAVGFCAGEGTYTAMGGGAAGLGHDHPLAAGPEESVEAVLASAGLDRFVIDLRSSSAEGGAWAHEARPFRVIGAMATPQQFHPVTIAAMFDVLVWQARTTASVPIVP